MREAAARVAAADRDRETLGFLHVNLTANLVAVGDVPAARSEGAKAIALCSSAGPGSSAVAAAIGHLALAHGLSGDIELAARLLGYWDALSNTLGLTRAFTEQKTYEQLSAILAARLASDERAALLAAGAALSVDEAIAGTPELGRYSRRTP